MLQSTFQRQGRLKWSGMLLSHIARLQHVMLDAIVESNKTQARSHLQKMQQYVGDVKYTLVRFKCTSSTVAVSVSGARTVITVNPCHCTTLSSFLQDVIAHGSKELGVPAIASADDALYDILLYNGCLAFQLAPAREGTLQACVTYRSQRLADSGLMGGIIDYMSTIQAIAYDLQYNIENGTLPRALSLAGTTVTAWHYYAAYLDHIISYFCEVSYDAAMNELTNYKSVDAAYTTAFAVILMLMYGLFVHPLVKRLDKRIKDARQLVVLFPDEIMRHVPAIMSLTQSVKA